MVKTLRELAHALLQEYRESKRIQREIDEEGIYNYIDKHYGPLEKTNISKPLHG